MSYRSLRRHDGVPGEPSGDEDDLDLYVADTVQIEMELTFPRGTTGEADDFWTAARSGEFDAAELAEANLIEPCGQGKRRERDAFVCTEREAQASCK